MTKAGGREVFGFRASLFLRHSSFGIRYFLRWEPLLSQQISEISQQLLGSGMIGETLRQEVDNRQHEAPLGGSILGISQPSDQCAKQLASQANSPAKVVRTLDDAAAAKLRQSAEYYVLNAQRFAKGLKRVS